VTEESTIKAVKDYIEARKEKILKERYTWDSGKRRVKKKQRG